MVYYLNMTMDQLIYFIACAETNSFTKTSKLYFVSQPAISTAIKNLEKELGCELFIRNNNELTLTDAGKYLYRIARPIVSLFKNINSQMEDYLMTNSTIKIGIPPMLGGFIFAPIFQAFTQNYPNVFLRMTELASHANQKAVINDEIDVALTVINNGIIDPKLDYEKIDETSLIFAVNKSNPLASRKSISIKELSNIPLILLKEDSLQYKIVYDYFLKYKITPNIRLLSDQIATIKELLLHSDIGAFLFNEVIKEGEDIIGIPLEENIKFDIVIAYKKNKTITSTTKKIIDFIIKTYKK